MPGTTTMHSRTVLGSNTACLGGDMPGTTTIDSRTILGSNTACPGGDMPGTTTIQLTQEEADAIGRLEALGFDRASCLVS
eukprot:1136228-Pelagomonas_calceolata.AAC.2